MEDDEAHSEYSTNMSEDNSSRILPSHGERVWEKFRRAAYLPAAFSKAIPSGGENKNVFGRPEIFWRQKYKLFLRNEVQDVLKKMTGFELDKIFAARQTSDFGAPKYKLMTDDELKEVSI